jgi:hypothetical protein
MNNVLKSVIVILVVSVIATVCCGIQDALANPFDGNWILNKSKMRQTELNMSQTLKRQGLNDSVIPGVIRQVEEVWSNIIIQGGKFTLSGEGKTVNCTIKGRGNAGKILCDNGSNNTAIRVNGSELIISPPGISIFLKRKQ